MFTKGTDRGWVEMLEGVHRMTLAHGDSTLLGAFRIAAGATIPMHQHPQEQTGYMVSGRMEFTIGGDVFTAESGDGWCIPPNVDHGVQVLEESLVVEVFSPRREDYMP
jgi:quercetin dioxygenase-like cupin family protein